MNRRMAIHGVPEEAVKPVEGVSRTRDQSVDSTLRLQRLQRYVTWTDEEFVVFAEALASQRQVGVEPQRY